MREQSSSDPTVRHDAGAREPRQTDRRTDRPLPTARDGSMLRANCVNLSHASARSAAYSRAQGACASLTPRAHCAALARTRMPPLLLRRRRPPRRQTLRLPLPPLSRRSRRHLRHCSRDAHTMSTKTSSVTSYLTLHVPAVSSATSVSSSTAARVLGTFVLFAS